MISKNPIENVKWRSLMWDESRSDVVLQRGLIQRIREDAGFWFDGFVWTFDPRREEGCRTLPMVLWDAQEKTLADIVEAVDLQHDLVADKSRDEGLTWLVLGEFARRFCVERECPMTCISRVEDCVDRRGDPDALFWKLDFLLAALPPWVVRADEIERRYLHFGNRRTLSTIDGRATTGDVGAGGRQRAMFFDEFARVPDDEEACASSKDTSRCRIFVSTPQVTGRAFKRMRFEGKIPVTTLHWSTDPRKNAGLYRSHGGALEVVDKGYSFAEGYPFVLDGKVRSPWYDKEDRERSRLEMAENVDIEYVRSGTMVFDMDVLAQVRAQDVREPAMRYDWIDGMWIPGGRARLHVWEEPRAETNYCVGSDVSMGQGASNSVSVVVDVEGGRKVAELAASDLMPEEYAVWVAALCRRYGGATGVAFHAWEQNGPGLVFGKTLLRAGERYIYWQRDERKDRPLATGRGKTRNPGWVSSRTNKFQLLGELNSALKHGTFVERSGEAVKEAESYVIHDSGEVGPVSYRDATSGAKATHGDRVIAAGLAVLGMREQARVPVPIQQPSWNSWERIEGEILAEREKKDDWVTVEV